MPSSIMGNYNIKQRQVVYRDKSKQYYSHSEWNDLVALQWLLLQIY